MSSQTPPAALPLAFRRRPTRRVLVGSVALGGSEPIRVQSMCTTDTGDTEATAQQALRLQQAGCEIVRVTVPNMPDAHALEPLRRRLEQLGVVVPLVADIHFNPHAAMVAADYVEKVRVNPGNYADTKRFAVREYTDDEYARELDRIREKFAPLVEKCKRLGRSMRIGTNHGSLSDRIMNRYGDSALGMVESALEFVRLCEEQDYRELVISMKSSNPFVAVQAYRLLAERMAAEGMDYPFHLGVTEAGLGEDGRVKSAIGIGALLCDGIGDTVRVSLTEDPVHEVPVAFELVRACAAPDAEGPVARVPAQVPEGSRRPTDEVALGIRKAGGSHVSAWVPVRSAEDVRELVAPPGSDAALGDVAWISVDTLSALEGVRGALWTPDGRLPLAVTLSPALSADPAAAAEAARGAAHVLLSSHDPAAVAASSRAILQAGASVGLWIEDASADVPALVSATGTAPLLAIVAPDGESPVFATRRVVGALAAAGLPRVPLLLVDRSRTLLQTATRLGGLLVDGMGDALVVTSPEPREALGRLLSVLQATRLRMTRPDYISCPSCGRTLFDLEEVTARIQSVTNHLKGVKIAIMGCIVNGPGEMADADFGYVGSSPGKINLYVGKDCVAKNVPAAEADDRLIALIKEHGRWVEPVENGVGIR